MKFLTPLRGLLFVHLTWDMVEEAAHLSKVFQADFTSVTGSMAAVINFRLRLMIMKNLNRPRLHFLQKIVGTNSSSEIPIVTSASDLRLWNKETDKYWIMFSRSRRKVHLVLKAATALNQRSRHLANRSDGAFFTWWNWSRRNHYKDNLLRAWCELLQIAREWSCMKSHVSLHLSGRSAEEVFASIFRTHADQCHSFQLLAEIVLIWLLSTAVVERGFSSMNRVKYFWGQAWAKR